MALQKQVGRPKGSKNKHRQISVLKTPESIIRHQPKYRPGAWMEYTVTELAEIVAYKAKLATHYVEQKQRDKAVQDAHNYLDMLSAKLNA